MFLEETPHLLAQIQEAVIACNSARLVAPAHTLKNWTGNCVASAAFEAVAQLEAMGRAETLATAAPAFAALEREIERLRRVMAQFNLEPASFNGEGALVASTIEPGSRVCTL